MIYDLMPRWLRYLLNMESATLPTEVWTWRHTCRYGGDPTNIERDYQRYLQKLRGKRRT